MNSHEVFIHIHQGCFAGTGAIVRLLQCQRSKPDGYGKISQCITTTKHSKAKTVCIFLGIYCSCSVFNRKSYLLHKLNMVILHISRSYTSHMSQDICVSNTPQGQVLDRLEIFFSNIAAANPYVWIKKWLKIYDRKCAILFQLYMCSSSLYRIYFKVFLNGLSISIVFLLLS